MKKIICLIFVLVTAINIFPARVFASNSLNTIDVNGTTYDAKKYSVDNNSSSTGNHALDEDALLRLLITQMQYQDPLDPQDNSEFIAQLAQFSSLEQMTNVSSGLSQLAKIVENIDSSLLIGQLSNMIGHEICWQSEIEETDENGNPTIKVTQYTGVIKGIKIVDGEPIVVANDGERDYFVNLSDIMSVSEITTPENTASILSVGYPEIVYGIGGLAVGFFAAMLIFRKKKVAVSSTSTDDEE